MKCVVCNKKIYSATNHRDIWIEVNGKLLKIPRRRFDAEDFAGFFTCASHINDTEGERCIDKLVRGDFE